ncbi:MAG TPA: hypothetical protein VHT53_06115 [Candidatus Elarobacter sp.]|nr:hypothetical protein [Candidatus Elarobacter sp.]
MPSNKVAKRLADPQFTPRIFASRIDGEDWWTTSLAALARLGGVARPGHVAKMARQRDYLPPRLLLRLRESGLITFTDLDTIRGRRGRWIALDDRHPCMAELREVLLVIGRRLE